MESKKSYNLRSWTELNCNVRGFSEFTSEPFPSLTSPLKFSVNETLNLFLKHKDLTENKVFNYIGAIAQQTKRKAT